MEEKFKQRSGYMVRPGADNFFEGGPYAQDNPVCEQQMVAAVREYYTCWRAEGAEARLASALPMPLLLWRTAARTPTSHTAGPLPRSWAVITAVRCGPPKVRAYVTTIREENNENTKSISAAGIASPKLRMKDPVWEVEGRYLPVNRVEAAMFMERAVKDAGESFTLEPKAIAHAEGTNMVRLFRRGRRGVWPAKKREKRSLWLQVFALWFRDGGAQAGIDLFFFGDDLKIASVACFREASAAEKAAHLAPH